MSSRQTTRSGRTGKPPKRLIEESELVKENEIQSKVNTRRPTKKSKEEFGPCFVNAIVAVIAGVTVLISSGLLLYFWIAVQRAYVELGNNDYMYSPAPIKPMTTQYNDGRGYYPPTSPQHFQMDDRK